LARVVREIHAERPVHGITTTADFFVPQAARAAEELGLPGLEYEHALAARNKHRARLEIQAACPEHNPRFALVGDAEAALAAARGWGMPLVAKPQDDNDGSNVRLIRSEDDLTRYMTEAQRWTINSAGQPHARGVLLEEYVDGPEFSIETLQCKGGPLQLIG